jgi:hypothetical protein
MEQIKILNMDFGRECEDRKTLVSWVIGKIKERAAGNDK